MRQNPWLPRLIHVTVFILLEAVALYLLVHNAALQRTWVARGIHSGIGQVWNRTQSVRSYFSLSATNQDLARKNFELTRELAAAREQLRKFHTDSLSYPAPEGFSLLPAEVVKLTRNSQHNYMILNRGFEDGVQEKSGVVTHNAVVGIIDAVSAHHAFAFSFQNSDISISARLGSAGETGLLVWDGIHSNGAILKEIPLQQQFHPGDTVFTSGHSLLFPPDIPLGIAGSSKIVNGATSEIQVRLFQDFSAVRYVTVVHNNAFDEIEDLEP